MSESNAAKEKGSVMKAYFQVENYLYGDDGNEKPLEIQAAILWGALLVVRNHGDIDENTMKKFFGEFMSRKMELM